MTVDKVIAKIIWLTFFGPPCTCRLLQETCSVLGTRRSNFQPPTPTPSATIQRVTDRRTDDSMMPIADNNRPNNCSIYALTAPCCDSYIENGKKNKKKVILGLYPSPYARPKCQCAAE